MPATLTRLREYAVTTSARIDRAQGVVYDVKVLGHSSRNGRRYTEGAMRGAIAKYEGCRVNFNHPQPRTTREYDGSRFGVLRGVYYKPGEGLYARELKFNPKHPLAEQFAWDAEHAPRTLGLSHNASGRVSRRGGVDVIEDIDGVESVDIVLNPATNAGLFEAILQPPFPATHGEFMEALGAKPANDSPSPVETKTAVPVAAFAQKLLDLLSGGEDDQQRLALVRKECESMLSHGGNAVIEAVRAARKADKYRLLVRNPPKRKALSESQAKPAKYPANHQEFIRQLRY